MSKVLRRFKELFVDDNDNVIEYSTFDCKKYFFENDKIFYLFYLNRDKTYTIIDYKKINTLINKMTKETFNEIRYYYMEYYHQLTLDNEIMSFVLNGFKNKGYVISQTYDNKYGIIHIPYSKEEITKDVLSMLEDSGVYSKHYNTQDATIEDAKTIVEEEKIDVMISDFERYFGLDFKEITGKDFETILSNHCDFEFINCDDAYCECNEYSCNCDGSCPNCKEFERTGGRSYYCDYDSCYAD